MEHRTRRQRRHQKHRIKNKRKAYHVAKTGTERHIAKHLKTPVCCSCWMCKNPRRAFGEATVQERRASNIEQLEDGDD